MKIRPVHARSGKKGRRSSKNQVNSNTTAPKVPFGNGLVRAAARMAKTGYRPNDGVAQLVSDRGFQNRLFREFINNRFRTTPVLSKNAALLTEKGAVVFEGFLDFTENLSRGAKNFTQNVTTFTQDIISWFTEIGHKAIIKARVEQSAIIEKSLDISMRNAKKMDTVSTISEINLLQKGTKSALRDSKFAYQLKKDDYMRHPSARNREFLDIAKKQIEQMRQILVEIEEKAEVKKAGIIKAEEDKLRNYLIIHKNRSEDSKRVQKFSSVDLKALSANEDPALQGLAKRLMKIRDEQGLNPFS